jgi:hypothetical protein
MPFQLHDPKSRSKLTIDFDSNTGWLIRGLCVIGFAVALYVAIASSEPGFSEFASMSAFP